MVAAATTATTAAAFAGETAASLEALPASAFVTVFSLTSPANLGDGARANNRDVFAAVKLA
jgi:hypothetical protein